MSDLASRNGFLSGQPADATAWSQGPHESLLTIGTERLGALKDEKTSLAGVISGLLSAADDRSRDKLRALEGELAAHAATITVIGQVKAGKTSVINVLTGTPGFLPSDVNPWTSVVTTVHVNKPAPRGNIKASFQFFERDEWDRLMRGGGRLGEMARRAGASDEMDRIEQQIMDVRRKSQERLGKNFELLLGQTHNYDRADTQLIERYVCMGDPDAIETEFSKQGRFADLTRAADIYLTLPQYPFPFSLQDTPGVNDPFLMREQITLRCVRNSELCIMVLSAAQALNTVDLALVRLLSTLDRRQLIIFVNRVDELERPAEQVEEIRASLDATLQKHGIGSVTDIIFGSAKWAEAAITGRPGDLPDAGQAALLDWARVADVPRDNPDPCISIWHLSGMPALIRAIGDRVAEGSPQRLMQKVRRDLKNVVTQSYAGILGEGGAMGGVERVQMTEAQVQARVKSMVQDLQADLRRETAEILQELRGRLNAASEQFVETTVAAMIRHIEVYGIEGQWECDPMRLRVQLRAAYMGFARSIRAVAQQLLARAAEESGQIYHDLLGEPGSSLKLEPPMVPQIPAPVAIGKTIVVDLQGGWWKRWIKLRRGAQAFAAEYRTLISNEANTIVAEIEEQQVSAVDAALRRTLQEFMDEHAQTLTGIAKAGRVTGDGLRAATGADRHSALRQQLDAAAAALYLGPAQAATA
ncbi:MAG TPA: dynamin family protein [Rubellimicrobium sp.]|nr:dynamin family protein [Rubellimicrobium sp.]